MSKNIFTSKTLWFNVLTAVLELLGVLPLAPGTTVVLVALVNFGLRLVTATGMVHAILQTIEAGIDRDLLNDSDVNVAVRKVMQSIVALENVVAAKRTPEEG